MGRFLRRKRVAAAPSEGGVWQVPAQFNFTRDVVEAFAADPLRPALTFVDREGIIDRRTFREVAADANRWAALLRARGLHPGDRLLVFVGKTPAWHAILLGALKAGLVTVPCSEMLRARDLAFRAEHSGARLVVADRERAPELARMDVPVEVVLIEEVAAELRELSIDQPTHDTAAGDIAFILYTSGTTKDPKGATHTHGYTWAQRLQAEHWLDAHPGDLVWCTAGTGWAKSIWNVLLGPWSCGAEIAIHEGGFDAEQRFDLIRRLGVTVLCQAPTEYRLMAKLPSLARFDLGRLRHAVSAGEPLNPEVIKAFRDAFGLTVYDGYGQTENTLLVANAPATQIKPGSMGLPTPGHEVAVIDDQGNEQPVGTEGDIALKGRPPSLFHGYWDAPDETSAVFRGDWYITGDRATRDEDGHLWFTGRADDVILSAAYRIGPFEVESALLEHPAVAESAVVGKPDADRGQLVKAFIVLAAGVEPSDELVVELQDHVKGVTAPYKYPREIEFVTELPKTASGKIRRVELRERDRAGRAGDGTPDTVDKLAELRAEASRQAEERAREAEARAAEILALEQAARVREEAAARAEEETRRAEATRAEEQVRREAAEQAVIEEAPRRKEARAAEASELAAVEAAARAERRADLEHRTANALAEEQVRLEHEARELEAAEQVRLAAEQARLAAGQARRKEEAQEAEQVRLAAEQARTVEEQSRREKELRAAEATERVAPKAASDLDSGQHTAASAEAATEPSSRAARREEERQRKEEERQRRQEEQRLEEEEKAAAEQRKRDEAEERRAAAERGREAERQRKEDEKRRREEGKEAAEQARREVEETRRAEQAAEADRRAAEDQQRAEEKERRREATRRTSTQPTIPESEHPEDDQGRLNPALIARLRAYGRSNDPEDPETPAA